MIYTAIDTFYLSEEELENSPSRKDGIDMDSESNLRVYGSELIQEAGILLKLPQAVMATGQVLYQRFYCKKSYGKFNVKRVAASCVWLAAKLEESPRKIRDVVNVFYRMDKRRAGLPLHLLEPLSKHYDEMKTDLIRTERHLLKEMGFVCHVEHPHKFIVSYFQQLEIKDRGIIQEAWNLANDSLRTTLCVRYKSEVIACGVIYAATCRAGIALPESPPWWLVFDAQKAQIDEVVRVLADLYKRPKAYYIDVSKGAKSFVLSTRAWEPPPDIQVLATSKQGINGANTAVAAVTAIVVETTVGTVDKPEEAQEQVPCERQETKCLAPESTGLAQDATELAAGEDIGEMGASEVDIDILEKAGTEAGEMESEVPEKTEAAVDTGAEKSRDVDKVRDERLRTRDRDYRGNEKEREGKERERETSREHGRIRNRERERDRVKDRAREPDHPGRGHGRDGGYGEKRHQPAATSRERGRSDYPGSHIVVREKDRSHRHHPYERPRGSL